VTAAQYSDEEFREKLTRDIQEFSRSPVQKELWDFQRADMVEAGWRVVEPVLDVWNALPPRDFPNYAAGTWGPMEADDLLEREGRQWRVRR